MDRSERFESLSRREFTALTAAAAGAVVAPGTAGESVAAGTATTDVYEFLVEHVGEEFEIPTLVTLTDESGFDVLEERSVPYRTRTEQEAVAHAGLTPDDVTAVSERDETKRLEYAPGANPFWKRGAYDDGVFPPPAESVDFIAYDEAVAGLEHLESANPDRLRFRTIGTGPGHRNLYEDIDESRELWAIDVTENVDDEATFEQKGKLVFSLSIHGDERAGIEAGLRFVEKVLAGERPEIEALLSEFVLVFVSPNPDGWVVREQLYEDPVEPPDFRRVNGTGNDLNRQFPNAGWIDPQSYPAEPDGGNLVDDDDGIDDDVPDRIEDQVPDALAVVDHLRTYENVEYFVDLHGMYGHSNAVLSLTPGGGSPLDRTDGELLNRAIEAEITESVGFVTNWESAFETAIEDTDEQYGCVSEWFCQAPVELFGYGTDVDAIGYTGTGFIESWASTPVEEGGLGATATTAEIVFSNSLTDDMANRFYPSVTAFHVAAYEAVCTATVQHAGDEIDATVGTGGRSTAYVETDTLTRRAADLPHFEGDAGTTLRDADGTVSTASSSSFATDRTVGGRGRDVDLTATSEETPPRDGTPATTLETAQWVETVDGVATTTTFEVPESAHTVSVDIRTPQGVPIEATLYDSAGNVARQGTDPGRPGRIERGGDRFTLVDPVPGVWTIEAHALAGPTDVEVHTTQLVADQDVPDPEAALGYRQRDYEVTPLTAFQQLAEYADAPVEGLTPDAIQSGALFDGGMPIYDNLVLTHDEIDDGVLAEIASFVEAGGNLVLTDAGTTVAADLDVAGLDAIGSDAVTRIEAEFATYGTADDEDGDGLESAGRPHPLLVDRRQYDEDSWIDQQEPWQHRPLGYAPEEVPLYEFESGALEDAGGRLPPWSDDPHLATVPTNGERVGVHLLGSLLPPAAQHNLHPFGLADHALTFFGYQLLCNALGYRLECGRNGEVVATFGETVEPTLTELDEGTQNDGTPADDGTPAEGRDEETAGSESPADGETPTDAATQAGDQAPTGTGTPTDDADGDGAGFGVVTGLASLGGLGYLLERRLSGGDDGD